MSKSTGRSQPLRLSFMPLLPSTNSGAETRKRFSTAAKRSSKRRFIRPIAFCVS